jgi:hypothetical protein
MKKVLVLFIQMVLINTSLFSQKFESVTVKAGMKVADCFPFNERYRYPKFLNGRIQLTNGVSADKILNYDFLTGEIEFLRGKDTLAISNGKDIRHIVIAADTFFYYKGGYLELISGGAVKIAMRQYIKLKETQKKDTYGTSSSGSATTSYGSLPVGGDFHMLVANEDMVFQRTCEYYISDPDGGYDMYNKKNVLHLYSNKEKEIKAYLKSEKINFDKRDDLIKLADYLSGL